MNRNMKKALPVILLIVMAVLSLTIRRWNNTPGTTTNYPQRTYPNSANVPENVSKFDRSDTNLFFTKHAKCRMACRHITEQEIKDILANGTVNYAKSNMADPRGATYAVEGITKERTHLRIIFAPKHEHMTVVTVIDLEEEFVCNCN